MKLYGARRDENEQSIVKALEAVGAAVQRLDPPVPDLLVSFDNTLYLLEVKDHDPNERTKPVRRNALEGPMQSLTKSQVKWWLNWKGKPPVIVHNAAEALRAIGADTSLPSELLPDALAVHHQRKPRIA